MLDLTQRINLMTLMEDAKTLAQRHGHGTPEHHAYIRLWEALDHVDAMLARKKFHGEKINGRSGMDI